MVSSIAGSSTRFPQNIIRASSKKSSVNKKTFLKYHKKSKHPQNVTGIFKATDTIAVISMCYQLPLLS